MHLQRNAENKTAKLIWSHGILHIGHHRGCYSHHRVKTSDTKEYDNSACPEPFPHLTCVYAWGCSLEISSKAEHKRSACLKPEVAWTKVFITKSAPVLTVLQKILCTVKLKLFASQDMFTEGTFMACSVRKQAQSPLNSKGIASTRWGIGMFLSVQQFEPGL